MSAKRLAVPAYYEIATNIREEIEAGRRKPGDLIPSEAQLCDAYGVSRMTVRQGLNLLSEAGYIQSVPGKGSYVSAPEFDRMSIDVSHLRMPDGRELTVSEYGMQISTADSWLAERLGIDRNSRVRELRRVFSDDGVAVGYQRTYLPWAGTRVPRRDELGLPFAELVARTSDRPFVKVQARVGAGRPETAEAEALRLARPAYGLYLEQTIVSPEEEVLGWARTCYHPAHFAFEAEFDPFYKRF